MIYFLSQANISLEFVPDLMPDEMDSNFELDNSVAFSEYPNSYDGWGLMGKILLLDPSVSMKKNISRVFSRWNYTSANEEKYWL